MPKHIFLVRHGQTDHNKNKIFQGWTDVSLNQKGKEQAKKLRDYFRHKKIDAVFTSDLKRATQTAKEISEELQLKPKKRTNLREQHLGKIEGESWENLNQKPNNMWEKILRAWNDEKYSDWKGHGGESVDEMYKRVKDLFQELHEKYPEKTVVLVTHGGVMQRIFELFKLKTYKEYISFKNTSITVLEKDDNGGYQVIKLNKHLK